MCSLSLYRDRLGKQELYIKIINNKVEANDFMITISWSMRGEVNENSVYKYLIIK